jgi:hypothetical protein
MAIPRNLVYVFACVIVTAFIGMLYIVYTEKDLKNFLTYDITSTSGGLSGKEDVVVHPLFWHLRNAVQQVDQVPEFTLDEMTTMKFYTEHLTANLPVVISDGAKDWPALSKWQNLEYIGDHFGEKLVDIMKINKATQLALGMPDYVAGRRNTFREFVNRTNH